MIRILNIMGSLNCGGAETTVMNLYRNIDRTKIQFDFLITVDEENYYENEANTLGARVFRRPKRTKDPFGNMKGLISVFKEHPEIKIVHIHHSSTVVAIDAYIAKRFGVFTRIVHSHNALPTYTLLHRAFRPFLRTLATHWLCCSTEAGISLFGKNAPNSSRFCILPNARKLETFRYSSSIRDSIRAKMCLEDHFVVVSTGRLVTQKNLGFLLEAFAHAWRREPNLMLLLAGDGPLISELTNQTDKLKLGSSVRFLGRRDDVPDLLQVADVFVLPSLHEGLPGAAIEAQTSGLPCLISDTVTRECKVTDAVEFLPISKGSEIWAERMLAYQGFNRRDTLDDVRKAGYDIKEVANKLEKFYFSEISTQR